MSYALGLPAALARRGLTVETVPGWQTRSAGSFNPGGAVCHWTAGPKGSRTRPSLNVVVNGRPGLPGPLCNVYLDRRGVAVVVAAGRANHAGTGGWRGLVGNSAVFGTEAEAAGADDWTAEMRWAYPRINAAYCDLGGFGAHMVCGHSEWAGPRKQDINGWPMSQMRADTAAILASSPTVEDDMYDTTARNEIVPPLYEVVGLARSTNMQTAADAIKIDAILAAVKGEKVDVNALGDRIAGNLVPAVLAALAGRGGLTKTDVEAAIRDVLGSLASAA